MEIFKKWLENLCNKKQEKITYLIHVHEHQDLFTKLVIIKTKIF